MKNKIPILFMLLAASITAIITYINNYDLISMLWALVITLFAFYVIGIVIVKIFSSFTGVEEVSNKVIEDEGAVIEKNKKSDKES